MEKTGDNKRKTFVCMLTVDSEETPETDTDEDDADIAHGSSIKTSGCALTAGVLVAMCGS